tara:strand:+ start:5768 stop:6085 length:318 start_codon:yes stop_codon:yes gene_type:complete
MTQSDKWSGRPEVERYWAFCADVRSVLKELPARYRAVFRIEMPKSWPKEKRSNMDGQPHQQTPDLDNLVKALQDACGSDHHIHEVRATKVWSQTSSIEIEELKGQ